jgi:hypothetical protein
MQGQNGHLAASDSLLTTSAPQQKINVKFVDCEGESMNLDTHLHIYTGTYRDTWFIDKQDKIMLPPFHLIEASVVTKPCPFST